MDYPDAQNTKPDLSQLLKLALEVGPLAIFFIANNKLGIFYATGAFMVATVASLIASRILLKRIPMLALVTGVFVMFFGFLTIYLHDDTFIKIKPTVVNTLFALVLATGLYFRRPLLKYALGEVMKLRDEGWRILTMRYVAFFAFLAILNEIVWRNFDADTWVAFKTWGVMPMSFLFMMAQVPMIMKHQIEEAPAKAGETQSS